MSPVPVPSLRQCSAVVDAEADALVQALVPLFESQHQTPRLLKRIGKREISSTGTFSLSLCHFTSLTLCLLLSISLVLFAAYVFTADDHGREPSKSPSESVVTAL
jgi:hypothetical protein